jgi:hypothetical protein
MSSKTETFLIDANTLINPFQKYYPFDLALRFWQCMEDAILSRDVILLDIVKEEILKGDDELTRWIQKFDNTVVLSKENEEILNMFREVLEYVGKCGLYQSNAEQEWAKNSVADGWLIASACTYGHTIVTFETPNTGLNPHSPSKIAKIPDVCNHFSVEYKNLFYMMRSLDFKL